ncbi:MAG: UDP-N-acetylmuramoyl-L-alanyl-D-glutamate--2,6-diaminopimelate ligase [Lachnospiraceae bacterium]|nr:UDP-N-acetylmuramoyl-L-alanyl-D-glutamate--2,6-diaminopimelate ligase [Lachnospiraceae bacterium]
MKLSELTERIDFTRLSGEGDPEITGIARDSRKAGPGDLFICTKGARFDSHDPAVVQALFRDGVRVFLAERPLDLPQDASVLLVPDTRHAGACVYAAWYGYPAERMTVVGITGSKGKTTTTHMLADILRAAGHRVGTIGTNGAIFGGRTVELANTTPESDEIQRYLKEMLDAGCDSAVLEISSQGMKQHRADGILFDYAVWMNLQEGDHIGPNEHESMEDYMFCKAELLNHAKLGFVHMDDRFAEAFVKLLHTPYETFGCSPSRDYYADGIEKIFDEETRTPYIGFSVHGKLETVSRINLPGDFNVWNALAAMAVADHMGVPAEAMNEALCRIRIRGRDDMVYRGAFSVCVDFAHNGASTWHHLEALREFRPKRLVCVFGADGNRSKGRRYGMGEAAGKLADFSIVTSGHNRWETFEAILEDTKVGLHKAAHPDYIAIKDRCEAIRYAIHNAQEGDLITIIGLGHESWQEEMGVKRQHSDIEFVKQVLREEGLLDS